MNPALVHTSQGPAMCGSTAHNSPLPHAPSDSVRDTYTPANSFQYLNPIMTISTNCSAMSDSYLPPTMTPPLLDSYLTSTALVPDAYLPTTLSGCTPASNTFFTGITRTLPPHSSTPQLTTNSGTITHSVDPSSHTLTDTTMSSGFSSPVPRSSHHLTHRASQPKCSSPVVMLPTSIESPSAPLISMPCPHDSLTVSTPVNHSQLALLLRSHPNQDFAGGLIRLQVWF